MLLPDRTLTDSDRADFAARFAKHGYGVDERRIGTELAGVEVFPVKGGRRFVIGYNPGEATGDLLTRALAETLTGVEMRASHTPSPRQLVEMYDEIKRLHGEWNEMTRGEDIKKILGSAVPR